MAIKANLHLALWGILGARDIKGIKVNVVPINSLDNKHLQGRKQRQFLHMKESS